MDVRVGQGYDIHPFAEGRKLVLGGIEIAHPRGLQGHSDADVVLHALGDALLGAAGLGDLGTYFPPSEARWKDADSGDLLRRLVTEVKNEGWLIGNCDVTVIAEEPRLLPHRDRMRSRIAQLLGVAPGAVGLTATTNERLVCLGRAEGIAALAVVLLKRP